MNDKTKIKMADQILQIIKDLEGDNDPMYDDDDLFEDKKGEPVVKVSVKKKVK